MDSRSCGRDAEAARCAAAGQVAAPGGGAAGVGRGAGTEVALAAAAVVAMGTGNRVLYKLALVPLREYPFFLAQFATFGWVGAGAAVHCAAQRASLAQFLLPHWSILDRW
jgi:hypothetical protein